MIKLCCYESFYFRFLPRYIAFFATIPPFTAVFDRTYAKKSLLSCLGLRKYTVKLKLVLTPQFIAPICYMQAQKSLFVH